MDLCIWLNHHKPPQAHTTGCTIFDAVARHPLTPMHARPTWPYAHACIFGGSMPARMPWPRMHAMQWTRWRTSGSRRYCQPPLLQPRPRPHGPRSSSAPSSSSWPVRPAWWYWMYGSRTRSRPGACTRVDVLAGAALGKTARAASAITNSIKPCWWHVGVWLESSCAMDALISRDRVAWALVLRLHVASQAAGARVANAHAAAEAHRRRLRAHACGRAGRGGVRIGRPPWHAGGHAPGQGACTHACAHRHACMPVGRRA